MFFTGSLPNGSPRATLRPFLIAAGFELASQDVVVTTGANARTMDVYRSPAAKNTEGKDWHFAISDHVTSGSPPLRIVSFSIMEGWDPVTLTATRFAPVSNNVAPSADWSTGATVGAVADLATTTMQWTDSTPPTFKLTADANRFVLLCGTGVAGQGGSIYVGLLDRVLSVDADPFPLVAVLLSQGNNSASQNAWGLSTREVVQGVANAYNWRIQMTGLSADRLYSASAPHSADALSGRQMVSPLLCHPSRLPATASRGILRGVRSPVGSSTVGFTDTLVETDPITGVQRTYYTVHGASIMAEQA